MENNLELWNKVCKTDPTHTKQFSRGGGFKGTATNVVYLIQKATSIWGPMGGKWGIRITRDSIMQGAPFVNEQGQVIGHELVHCVQAEFFHPDGAFPSYGQTTFVGKNKHGFFTDEEAPKKSLTDALSKALSWLGFSADIHMGLYDDNKYVSDLRREFAEQGEPKIDVDKHLIHVTDRIAKFSSTDDLSAYWGEAVAGIADEDLPKFELAFKNRAKVIKQAAKQSTATH